MTHYLAFNFDTNLGEFSADLFMLFMIGVNAWVGYRSGLMRRIFATGGMILGCLGATAVGNALTQQVAAHDLYNNAWGFIVTFMIILGMFEVLGLLYHDSLQRLVLITFDRTAGLIFGAILGFVEAGVVFLAIFAATTAASNGTPASGNRNLSGDAVRHAMLAEVYSSLEDPLKHLLAPVLPGNFPAHLSEGVGTNNTTNPLTK